MFRYKSNKKMKPILKYIIYTTLVIGIIGYNFWIMEVKKPIERNLRIDALRFISRAQTQYTQTGNDCISIEGDFDPENFWNVKAGNYIGSVGFTGDESKAEIWLSDGEYIIRGTEDNLEIYPSASIASVICGKQMQSHHRR